MPEEAMHDVRQGMMGLGVVMLVACGTSTDATSPRPTITEPSFSKVGEAGKRVSEQRVTGHIAIILPAFDNALEFYSLSAIRHRDGSVTGEFNEFSQQMGGQRIRAHVVCFTVAGDTARLAAQIDKTDVPFGPVGSYVVWSVVDNGQGRRSAPDETTDIFFGGTAAQAQFHCDTGFDLAPFFTGLRGNLRVR
jgi:hypothetical protein